MSTLAFSPLLSFGTTTTLRQIDGVFQLNALEYSILESRCWCPEQSNVGYVCVCVTCASAIADSEAHATNTIVNNTYTESGARSSCPLFRVFAIICVVDLFCIAYRFRHVPKSMEDLCIVLECVFFSLVRAPITENSRTQQAVNVAQNITRSSTCSSEQCRRTTDESTWESTSL